VKFQTKEIVLQKREMSGEKLMTSLPDALCFTASWNNAKMAERQVNCSRDWGMIR
jgi:hypothetical protein